MKSWIFIIIAVVLQTLWGLVLKILDFGKAWTFIKHRDIFNLDFALALAPIVAYLLLGLFIALSLSRAYKLMPLSIVYAAWMGLTLTLQVVVDLFFFKVNMYLFQYVFILLVLIGIIGMKLSNPKTKS